MEMQATPTPGVEENEGLTKQSQPPVVPHSDTTIQKSNLQFNKMQQLDTEIKQESRCFGVFVAREALLDEEYWQPGFVRRVTGKIDQMKGVQCFEKEMQRIPWPTLHMHNHG